VNDSCGYTPCVSSTNDAQDGHRLVKYRANNKN
jgi:hypothetical protein